MHPMVMKLINTAITFQMIIGCDAINKSSADATHATALHVLKWQFTSSPALRGHNASRVLYKPSAPMRHFSARPCRPPLPRRRGQQEVQIPVSIQTA